MGWFPLYDEFFDDPKLAAFSEVEQLRLLKMMREANRSPLRGVLPYLPEDLAAQIGYGEDRDAYQSFLSRLIDRKIVRLREDGAVVFLNWDKRRTFGRQEPAVPSALPTEEQRRAYEREKKRKQRAKDLGDDAGEPFAERDCIVPALSPNVPECPHEIGDMSPDVPVSEGHVPEMSPNVPATHARAGIKPPNQNRESGIDKNQTANQPTETGRSPYETLKSAQEMAWLVGGGGYKDFLGFLTQRGLESNWAEAACANIRDGPPAGKVQNPYRYLLSVANRLKGQTQQSWPMPVVVPGGRQETEEEKTERLQREAQEKAVRQAAEEITRQERAARMAALAGQVNVKEGTHGGSIAASA